MKEAADQGGAIRKALEHLDLDELRQLSQADMAQIHLLERDHYVLANSSHTSAYQVYLEVVTANPIAVDRRTLVGRVGLDRQAQQITDVLADSEYGRPDLQRVLGYRTILGVPIILDDEVIGVLAVGRTEVNSFGSRDLEVLSTFAEQAAIAVRTAR